MHSRTRIALALAALGSAVAASVALAAIPVYVNNMSSTAARSQLVRLGEGECMRGAGGRALRVTVGERTRECELRTPVVGANLDVTATARLLAGTPQGIQRRVFVAVAVRSGGDGGYLLAVFPRRGTYQLARETGGELSLLANGEAGAVNEVGQPNRLRIQAFPSETGQTRVTAFINGRRIASVLEEAHVASTVTGRFSSIAVGSAKAANGARASFDSIRVSVPDPF